VVVEGMADDDAVTPV